MSEFKDKIVLVTGSSRGIGLAITQYFLAAGARVHGVSSSKGFKENNYTHWQVDLSDFEEVERWSKRFFARNKINILINNAGIYPQNELLAVTEEEWEQVFAINLKSLFFLSIQAATSMKKQKGGVIVNAASYAGTHPSIGSGVYAATKASAISFTKSMAAEWAPYNIRVNAYSPGFILTDMTQPLYEEHGEKMLESVALERYGEPIEIAEAVGFICSEKAAYITGENIKITGGKFLVQNQQKVHK